MSTNVRSAEKRIDQEPAVASMVDSIYRLLGRDVRGYELRHYLAADEIRIVDPATDDVVDATALDGRSIHDYREWVETEVDKTTVNWDEEAF